MGGGHAPARQGAPTAAIAASPARNHHSRHLRHAAVSGAHAGKHAHTWGWGWGNAAVGGKQGAHGRRGGSKRGKGERQKLHNCNTCRARSKETLKWAPWRRPMRSAPWLRTPWPARVGYRTYNKSQRFYYKSKPIYQSQITIHLPTNHITYITISLTISHSHSILTNSILLRPESGYNKKL